MDINAARVPCPDIGFRFPPRHGQGLDVMLLHPHLPHGKPCSSEGSQQLMAGVKQSLQPGTRCRSHGEHPPLQREGTAMGGQLGPGQPGPGLPQGGQMALPLPVLLEGVQTSPKALRRSRGGRHQKGDVAQNSLFLARTPRPAPLGTVPAFAASSAGWGGSVAHDSLSVGVRERVWARFGKPQSRSPQTEIPSVTYPPMLPRPMGFFDRLSRLLRANLNDLVSKAEDPAKILDQSLADMQADLVKLRQAVATAIASQRRLQNQAEQADTQSKAWYQRAEVALQKGEETLAREALSRRKTYQDTATALNNQINSQAGQVETLKKSLTALEAKIAEAKTKKDMLKARAQAAQAQEQLQTAVNNLGTNNAMAAFEQMEEKVLSLEARSQAAAELAGADLESQFAALESSDVDDELAALKQRLEGGANPIQLPAPNGPVPQLEPAQVAEVDAELQELKRSIDKL